MEEKENKLSKAAVALGTMAAIIGNGPFLSQEKNSEWNTKLTDFERCKECGHYIREKGKPSYCEISGKHYKPTHSCSEK